VKEVRAITLAKTAMLASLRIGGSKFKSSNKILVQGGWFRELNASKPARRLAKPLAVVVQN